ncbi:MAG TPA: redoxin family protein, partial [Sphingomicrobium sp.]|nr:redoxin family protein [Sphingomicrobium sp.]
PPSPAVPSQMVERHVPPFDLPAALPTKPGLKSPDLATGHPRMVNIFASWCVPCASEAPVLNQLKARGIKIDAIAVRDTPDAITAFLAEYGDPYEAIGSDARSNVQMDLGSSGVPETFIVDGKGVIRRQYIGPLSSANIPEITRQMAQLQ